REVVVDGADDGVGRGRGAAFAGAEALGDDLDVPARAVDGDVVIAAAAEHDHAEIDDAPRAIADRVEKHRRDRLPLAGAHVAPGRVDVIDERAAHERLDAVQRFLAAVAVGAAFGVAAAVEPDVDAGDGARRAVSEPLDLAGRHRRDEADDVVAVVAAQKIVVVAAVEPVGAVPADEDVVAGFAVQVVVEDVAEEHVGAGAAPDVVAAAAAVHDVVAGAGVDDVVTVGADEAVGVAGRGAHVHAAAELGVGAGIAAHLLVGERQARGVDGDAIATGPHERRTYPPLHARRAFATTVPPSIARLGAASGAGGWGVPAGMLQPFDGSWLGS